MLIWLKLTEFKLETWNNIIQLIIPVNDNEINNSIQW